MTTHWCGDWNVVDRVIAAQPGLGYLTIDAYHNPGTDITDMLCRSTADPRSPKAGLGYLKKPILVTEFGGSAWATDKSRLRAEHAIGPWAGLVAGHAGAPMLWWFEWIDQEDGFGVYGAINRFIAGEDLRGADAATIAPATRAGATLWCRAWARRGRILGYVVDRAWSLGEATGAVSDGVLLPSAAAAPGAMTIAWWDADRGCELSRRDFTHGGGLLELPIPPFTGHVAFKLWRR